MRNQALIGYVLHHKPYQDKRALCYLFTPDYGVVHGVSRRGLPLFERLQLFANGKRALKNFSQIQLATTCSPIVGTQQYAGLYLNEVLFYLLSVEDPVPQLWYQYEATLTTLREPLTATELRLCLRLFESYLFTALGHEVLLTHDDTGKKIVPNASYRYMPDAGLVLIDSLALTGNTETSHTDEPNLTTKARSAAGKTGTDENTVFKSLPHFTGEQLQQMHSQGINVNTLPLWSQLFYVMIDHLLEYRPLQSRLLWQQQRRYTT